MMRDYLDAALLDIATFYRDVMLAQSGGTDSFINREMSDQITKMAQSTAAEDTLRKLEVIMKTRVNLGHNAAPLLTIEAMMVQLR